MASEFPRGGGACGALIRSIDWSTTPLGPMATWSPSLRTTLQIMLGSRQPMFLWWGPALIQLYNDAYVPSFGRGKHPAAMGQRGVDCWGEIWPIIGPQIEGVMTRGEPTWHEDALVPIHRNGRIEEVYWTYGYSPVHDVDGEVGGTLVVCTETTERMVGNRRQRALRRLAEHASTSPRPHQLVADALARLADDPEDLPFIGWFDADATTARATVGLGDDVDAVRALIARHLPLAGPTVIALDRPLPRPPWPAPVREVFVVPALDGLVGFGLSAYLSFDAGYRAFVLQLLRAIDLAHDRSRAHAIRASTEAERRDLLMQAPIATALMTGPDHVFMLANPRYVAMVGREVLGKTYAEAFPEVVGTPLAAIVDDVYRRGIPFVTNELCVALDRDGTGALHDTYFRFNLEPIRDGDGQVYGMMVIALDITDIVAARDERLALIAEREAANQAKDEFLALLGHELRNPLAPITTALDLIRGRGDDPAAREHQIIVRQVAHLTRLVDDLLDVSRIVRGKVELRRETANLGDVVTKAIEMAADLLERRRHHLAVTLPPAPVTWWGDPVRLAQVIANLLTNAARYTDPGGNVALTVTRRDHQVELTVVDDGRGISAELLPSIFRPFVQGPRATEGTYGGLGIGLTLVKSLVELHGGAVHAASDGPGRGSRFTIHLPLADAPPRAATAPVTAERERERAGRRVLLVDDNVDAAELLAELLRISGHDVVVAHDAVTALAEVTSFVPEVAVLDIGLPVIDGYELAERLRALPGLDDVRLVALTGYGQDGDRERAARAGFARHLVKPVAMTTLLAAITHDR